MVIHDKEALIEFFHAVKQCRGEVLYRSGEGDQLNLKSALSQFLLSTVLLDNPALLNGSIVCGQPEDLELLQPFLAK